MIETERLVLRPAVAADAGLMERLWGDPRVMANIAPVFSAEQARVAAGVIIGTVGEGLGAWMLELRATGESIGFCALRPGEADTPAAGQREAGWLLGPSHWRQGLGSEAVAALIDWGWQHGDGDTIVAITPACNIGSQRLMERIGMTRQVAFDHPHFAPSDRLRASLLYAIGRPR